MVSKDMYDTDPCKQIRGGGGLWFTQLIVEQLLQRHPMCRFSRYLLPCATFNLPLTAPDCGYASNQAYTKSSL